MVPKLAVLVPMASWWGKRGGPMASGASNVDSKRQVVKWDEFLVLLSVLEAAIGFPPCQLWAWARGTNLVLLLPMRSRPVA
jgi:hypothetical protein